MDKDQFTPVNDFMNKLEKEKGEKYRAFVRISMGLFAILQTMIALQKETGLNKQIIMLAFIKELGVIGKSLIILYLGKTPETPEEKKEANTLIDSAKKDSEAGISIVENIQL